MSYTDNKKALTLMYKQKFSEIFSLASLFYLIFVTDTFNSNNTVKPEFFSQIFNIGINRSINNRITVPHKLSSIYERVRTRPLCSTNNFNKSISFGVMSIFPLLSFCGISRKIYGHCSKKTLYIRRYTFSSSTQKSRDTPS